MPEPGRVLQFRARTASTVGSYASALAVAADYLSRSIEDRLSDGDPIYSNPDVLMALCTELRSLLNVKPTDVGVEAERIYRWLAERSEGIGFFDERHFFMGDSALLAASGSRLVGEKADTELWLDRADASFRHTVNPSTSLARVAYLRLTLRYDDGRYSDVLELVPSVALTFEQNGMHSELVKCRFLEAVSLKELHRYSEAVACLQRLLSSAEFSTDSLHRGLALMSLGNIRSHEGDHSAALGAYKDAQAELRSEDNPAVLANLKAMVADTLNLLGRTVAAVDAYRESVSNFLGLGMLSRVAYLRVMLAEVLLSDGRAREAEWELLAALPAINEHKMVPEGFAAMALLQESLRQRKTDPQALSELRQYLKAQS